MNTLCVLYSSYVLSIIDAFTNQGLRLLLILKIKIKVHLGKNISEMKLNFVYVVVGCFI